MIEVSYNFYLVGLSYTIAVFGSYSALQLAIRIPTAQGKALWGWLSSAALALGGGAIWSMHFIGMLAYKMPMEVGYDLPLTIASLVIAVVVAAVGLFIVGRGKSSLIKLIFAGVAGGLGVCAMHYTGMAAMVMPADISYNHSIVALSFAIAIAACIVALWLAFNLRGNLQRFGSALVMGVAVCGMHYTAMSGMTMTTNEGAIIKSSLLSSEVAAIIIFAIASSLLAMLLMSTMFQATKNAGQDELGFE